MKLPQLTLRDLFWLVLVCATGLAFWVQSRYLASENQRLRRAIYSAGYHLGGHETGDEYRLLRSPKIP